MLRVSYWQYWSKPYQPGNLHFQRQRLTMATSMFFSGHVFFKFFPLGSHMCDSKELGRNVELLHTVKASLCCSSGAPRTMTCTSDLESVGGTPDYVIIACSSQWAHHRKPHLLASGVTGYLKGQQQKLRAIFWIMYDISLTISDKWQVSHLWMFSLLFVECKAELQPFLQSYNTYSAALIFFKNV